MDNIKESMPYVILFLFGLLLGAVWVSKVPAKLDQNIIYYASRDIEKDLSIMKFDYKDVKILEAREETSEKDGYTTYSWIYEYTDEKGLQQRRTGVTTYYKERKK